ncbi:MAG: hypothetical protein K6A33_07730 [Clostridiales bacterium]|nr:hypothetical protein [Clostridiales bacterium]
MKRIAAALSAVLLLTAASCTLKNAEPLPDEEEHADVAIEQPASAPADVPEEAPADEPAAPTDPVYVSMKPLELESKPYFQNGELILYFTNHEIWYEENEAAYIGMISDGSAMSVPASIVTSKHPELEAGEDYLGVALLPSEPIPAGSYTFTVTFSEYIVSFEMTVD